MKSMDSTAHPNTEDDDNIFENYFPKYFSVLANFVTLRFSFHEIKFIHFFRRPKTKCPYVVLSFFIRLFFFPDPQRDKRIEIRAP